MSTHTTPAYTTWFTPRPTRMRTAPQLQDISPGAVLVPKVYGDHSLGQPSPGVERTYEETFSIPFARGENDEALTIHAHLEVNYTVEDWGDVFLKKEGEEGQGTRIIGLKEEDGGSNEPLYGGHTEWSGHALVPVESGNYTLTFSYKNIDMPEDINLSICKYDYEAKAVEVGGHKDPEPQGCGCSDSCGTDGGPQTPQPAPQPAALSEDEEEDGAETGTEGDAASTTLAAPTTSTSGSRVRYELTEDSMLWSCNTATLRGQGTALSGKVQLCADAFAPALASPAALCFNHPMQARLIIPEGGITPGARLEIHFGTRIIALRYYTDGSITPIGVDTAGHGLATPTFAEDGTLSSLRWQEDSGAAWEFDAATGALLSYTGAEGSIICDVSQLMQVCYDAEGAQLRQIWSYWDGLLNIEDITESGYRIALYTAAQVAGQNAEGSYELAEGATPFKSFTLTYAETGLTITEHTPGREDYACCWSQGADGAWNLTRGSGEDAIIITRERSVVEPVSAEEPYEVWLLVTTTRKGNTPAACRCEVYQNTPLGNLLLTQVEGYGAPEAQTTYYTYDGAGNVKETIAPNGHTVTQEYDSTGRLMRRIEPWGNGDYTQITEYSYAYSGGSEAGSSTGNTRYSDELASVTRKLHKLADHSMVVLSTETYTRSEADGIRREELRRTASGSEHTELSVTETWLGSVENEWERGRTRMTQAANGVQTWYSYAATTEHGALYSVTTETKVNGEAVRSHSTRSISYIDAMGNTLRREEWALLYNNEWVKTSGTTYTYNAQNQLTGITQDNGRRRTQELTCTGEMLWEVNEDGIRTDYAYDAARQLIEITRAEVMDGDTCITPETITEYTRDAAGRILTTKVHIGPMVTEESTTYDLAGRVTSQTDVLGRTTTTTYSADGLSTTVTQPNGATLISTQFSDGQQAAQSGTGQPARCYRYDVVDGCQRSTTLLGDGESILSEEHRNGFGQSVLSRRAVPNGFVCTHNNYNAKGQRVRTQQDDGDSTHALAPTLYSYDSFGNVVRETLALTEEETSSAANSRLTIHTYSKLQQEDGIYSMVTITHNNSAGGAYNSSTAQLISALSATLESKTEVTDPRGNSSLSWTERGTGAVRVHQQQVPTSTITATARVVDGLTTTQTDTAGITTSQSRSYTASGITHRQTDGRGNTTTTHTDLAGRTLSTTDAAGNTTTTAYCTDSDNPATITNAQGKTTCYRYDLQGRKIAEWGTAIQPACFAYDAEGNLTRLTTYRADEGDITTDPTNRTDGDSTTWTYDSVTSLELSKTYADGSSITKTYDSFGRLSNEQNARNNVKTYTYHSTTGELNAIIHSDGVTPAQTYTYTLTGKLSGMTDAAGTRTFAYNDYDELISDSLSADNVTHLITETMDSYGRSTGYTYARGGSVQQSVSYGYGTDGRLSTAGFTHGGEAKQFSYAYLPGTHLLQTLTMPNGMTLTQQYEQQRDLLTAMLYKRGETSVAERTYTYDTLGRPLTRTENRQGGSRSDSFTHNDRSELTNATLGTVNYAYAYDNIGNRKTAQEDAEEVTNYDANNLNQYTAVGEFAPEFDADGNQTLVQTSTGIWNVTYNAENRPTKFTRSNTDGTTTKVTCAYDYMGRRATKKVETIATDGTAATTLHQRYLYRGYLQIACCDLTRDTHPCLWLITWDPTQSTATRPLAIQKDATWYTYGWDLTKNVCEVFSTEGTILTTYRYTPYGSVTADGNTVQPIQWSSEFCDDELGLVYYNYRHYNKADGRWHSRDPYNAKVHTNLYKAMENSPVVFYDSIGLYAALCFAFNTGRISGFDSNNPSTKISLNNVFSGNQIYKNQYNKQCIENKGPLPEGEYWIDFPYIRDNHPDNWWFRLYGDDGKGGKSYEDVALKDIVTGEYLLDESGEFRTRGHFNMHVGAHSNGCVTATSEAPEGTTRYPYSTKYTSFAETLIQTGTDNPFLNPRNPNQKFVGVLHVTRCEKNCASLLDKHRNDDTTIPSPAPVPPPATPRTSPSPPQNTCTPRHTTNLFNFLRLMLRRK